MKFIFTLLFILTCNFSLQALPDGVFASKEKEKYSIQIDLSKFEFAQNKFQPYAKVERKITGDPRIDLRVPDTENSDIISKKADIFVLIQYKKEKHYISIYPRLKGAKMFESYISDFAEFKIQTPSLLKQQTKNIYALTLSDEAVGFLGAPESSVTITINQKEDSKTYNVEFDEK